MGVVYKLKQEVIDYIVRKKKDEPSLSCRKLVDIINAEFGLNVSKSSVNAVIKQFNLSNPVGRLPTYKPPKNFSIPQEKKNLLYSNVVPFLSPPEEAALKKEELAPAPSPEVGEMPAQPIILEEVTTNNEPVESVPEAQDLLLPQEPIPLIEVKEELHSEQVSTEEGPVALSLPPDSLAGDRKEEEAPRPLSIELRRSDDVEMSSDRGVWSEESGTRQEGLGLFLLLAALWDMETGPVLGEILARHLGLKLEPQIFEKLEAAAIIQAVMRGEDGSIILDGIEGFLRAQDIDDKSMAAWLHALDDKNIIARLERVGLSQFETQLTMVGSLQLITEEDKAIYIDPSFMVCDMNVEGVQGVPGPLCTTVERTVDAFVTNSVPVVIGYLPFGDPGVLTGFYEAMEGLPGHGIREIALLGLEGEKVFLVKNLFSIRKAFIVGTTLSAEQLATFEAEMLDNSRKYFDPFFGKEFSYFEGTVSLPKDNLRVRAILLQEKGMGKKEVLLTNTKTTAEEIIDLYTKKINYKSMGYEQQKNLENELSNHLDVKINRNIEETKPLRHNITELLYLIFRYFDFKTTIEKNSDIKSLFRHFCTVQATIKEKDFGVFIRFYPPESFPCIKELESVLALLNRRGISNHAGHRLFFSLSLR